jgi:hypothetical protein
MTKASDSAEPFGPELKAEGLVAGRQSLRKDPINIVYLRVAFTIIRTHFPDEPVAYKLFFTRRRGCLRRGVKKHGRNRLLERRNGIMIRKY